MIAPPNTEAAVVAALDAGMTSATIATAVENPRPTGAYGRVTVIGGTDRNLVQSDARLLCEFWGDTQQDAFNAAQLAWALLWAAQDSYLGAGVYVTRVESTVPVNFPDPDTKSPRYQFISTITAAKSEVSV